ncbi:hypothetical protein MCB86_08970 [Pseudomonas sp. KSR10]|uniref:hypothetical protein n=1 Tax=Pseudomonas sp. KSR10 TaxID=2916654 RepID=UPI001EF85C8D|nr:hypothetical protein [Pseudomonas sp. KSR10]MCG6540205.1 hypothetical protein [Pseudomonas sp. KSR10]
MYIWIFLASYLAAFLVGFFVLSQRVRAEANHMIERGLDAGMIDDFYAAMGRPTLVAVVRITAVSGTLLGAVGSLVAWVFLAQ